MCGLLLGSSRAGAAGLRLVCEVDGRALEPARLAQGKVLLADGSREIEAPKGAQWRLEGDLRENADSLLLSPAYGVYEQRNKPGDEKWDAQRPLRGYAGIRHELAVQPGRVQPGRLVQSPFLKGWPDGTSDDALLVGVWMLDGRAAFTQAAVIPASDRNNFSRQFQFKLTREEGRGQAVLLLWQAGGFVAPKPRLGPGLGQKAMVAAIFDDALALSDLLKQGLDVSKARTEEGITLAHFAAEAGSVHALDVLLKTAPQLANAVGGDTRKASAAPLSWAVGKIRVDAIKRLFAAKADPNPKLKRPEGSNYLLTSAAVVAGNTEALSLLLAAGSKKEAGRFDMTALDSAIITGDCRMADLLCEKGGPSRGFMSELQNGDALRLQLRKKNYDMALWLLQHGLKIQVPSNSTPANSSGYTDFYAAAVANYSVGRADTILRALLAMMPRQGDEERFAEVVMNACQDLLADEKQQRKAMANGRVNMVRRDASPLAEASLAGCLPLARRLLASGCPVNEPLFRGRRALHYAAAGNAVETAALLIEKGATPDAPDNDGLTPLDVALANGAAGVARLLAAKGARLNPESRHAEALLVEAIKLDLPEVVVPAVRAGVAAKTGAFSLWTARRVAEILDAKGCVAALSENAGDDAGAEEPAGVPVVGADKLDKAPEMRKKATLRSCVNPLESRKETIVRIRALVGPEGDVLACLSQDTDAPAALQQTAMDSIRQCKLTPPRSEGRPVAVWLGIPVTIGAIEAPLEGENGDRRSETTDVMPRVTQQSSPYYPAPERSSNKQGVVMVTFVVGKNGQVEEDMIDVVRATTRNFSEATVKAIASWRFIPGMYGGKPVRAAMFIPVVFQLKG